MKIVKPKLNMLLHISQYLKRKHDLKINCSKALIETGFNLEKDENEPSLVYVKKATTRNKTSNREQARNKNFNFINYPIVC